MRKSGILMHITSLPSPYGIGTMGKCAYEFVDFLVAAGQSYWQVLPLSPTGYGDSPYQAFSAFAGNHYLIDPDILIAEGLLTQEEADAVDWGNDPARVDFGRMYDYRTALLRKAYERFTDQTALKQFVLRNADWLEDYALFMALKEAFHGRAWQDWSVSLLMRLPAVLNSYRTELNDAIRFQYFLQYQFFRQWSALRAYANAKGVRIIGDVPIYVPLDSADVWANSGLFLLDPDRRPQLVAGCPPDSFSADGQRWGNPLYNWQTMKNTGYDWWIRRLKAASQMYDVIRLDHFRGFESYWAIPAKDTTAVNGTWEKGPGIEFIRAIQAALPGLSMIAEDLGYVTPEVRKLQEDSGYPGMKVLQFAFDSREEGDYLPHAYTANSVCYSGTHDNLTMAQWFQEAAPEDIDRAVGYLGLNQQEGYVWGMLRGCMSSVSKLCVIQLQDYLELGGEARMNFPGTFSAQNWTWRVLPGMLTQELAQRIRTITARYGRI
ncbi:MAG: 4-alpha-glucanotransferase [Oscillospiraceae bacterium]|nr:4-alpha-glucanotransferase [Oscillospiraceae bacterium]